jgi:hypothetical protein
MTETERLHTFYLRWFMARPAINPRDYGIDLDHAKLADKMLAELAERHDGKLSIDKLVCRPALAAEFCQAIRAKYGWIDVPDYVILEPMMNRRKNKTGRMKVS